MVCLFTEKINKILNFEYFFDYYYYYYYYYFYIKYYSAPITAKDIKKEKENMHRPIHSKPGPIRSLFLLLLLLLLLLYGPIRSRLVEHNKYVKLEKSIRSKLFSPIHTFSQSPLTKLCDYMCGNVGYNQHNVELL